MTTIAPVTVEWIRLAIGGSDLVLSPSPDFGLNVTVVCGERDDCRAPLTFGPSDYSLAVDLVPLQPRDFAAVARCETRARDVAAWLGFGDSIRSDFALEAGLGGEDRLHNRMEVPRLQLVPADRPEFDDAEPLPSVRVFTARMLADDAGASYVMRMVD